MQAYHSKLSFSFCLANPAGSRDPLSSEDLARAEDPDQSGDRVQSGQGSGTEANTSRRSRAFVDPINRIKCRYFQACKT